MLYAETLRHFVQEWIEIQSPKDKTNWPWKDSHSRLFLINLYSISGAEPQPVHPTPFISILINDIEDKRRLVEDGNILYSDFFKQDLFVLPRRYKYEPFILGDKNFRSNRFIFTGDAYGEMASNWSQADLTLLEVLANRPHARYNTLIGCDETVAIMERLDALAKKANVNNIKCAEDVFDFTDHVTQSDHPVMLIQAPLSQSGIMSPIKKSKRYRIINGTFIVCNDPVLLSIKEEPCDHEYDKARIPFENLYRNIGHVSAGDVNAARAITYIAVESFDGVFSFQEFTPSHKIITRTGDGYVRVMNHIFTIQPESIGRGAAIGVRLHHNIVESLVPNTRENQRFFRKRTHEKLFARTNLPDEYRKDKQGNLYVQLRTD